MGYLTRWRVDRAIIGEPDGWTVHLGAGNSAGTLVDARTRETRVFRSLDSAVRAIEEIGFSVDSIFQG